MIQRSVSTSLIGPVACCCVRLHVGLPTLMPYPITLAMVLTAGAVLDRRMNTPSIGRPPAGFGRILKIAQSLLALGSSVESRNTILLWSIGNMLPGAGGTGIPAAVEFGTLAYSRLAMPPLLTQWPAVTQLPFSARHAEHTPSDCWRSRMRPSPP